MMSLNQNFISFLLALLFTLAINTSILPGPLGCRQVEAINSVLDINGTFPYLRDNVTGAIIEPRDYMDFDNLYMPNETYRLHQTAQGRNYHMLKAFDFANYYQSDYWHYSSRRDLEQSAWPVADVARCERDLDWLETQLNRTAGEALFHPGEQHINLMTLMDSYGHPEAGTYYGHGYWLGSYYECKRLSIDLKRYQAEEDCQREIRSGGDLRGSCIQTSESRRPPPPPPTTTTTTTTTTKVEQPMRFRYCVGKAHDRDWPLASDNYVPKISYKVGLCLPESCETLTYERRPLQLERLMQFNLPEFTRARIRLHEIYCVPDDRSPIRQLPASARVFLAVCLAWVTALVVATCVYSCYKRHQRDLREILQEEKRLILAAADGVKLANGTLEVGPATAAKNGHEASLKQNNNFAGNFSSSHSNSSMLLGESLVVECQASRPAVDKRASPRFGAVSAPSSPRVPGALEDNSAALMQDDEQRVGNFSNRSYSSSMPSLSAWLAESPLLVKVLQAISIKETLREFQRPPKALEMPGAGQRLRVNLNALDAIKCICCVLVIFGHIIFIHMQHLSNIVHTIELSNELYPRMLIAFFNFVDTFFIISGMLTAYFIFKRFNKRTLANPLLWLQISLLRLFRLSPVYILVFWFIKTTSVYMTHGPIWDYGTDKNSIKGLCINDHWWKSILYLGNTGTMQPICILPAWSIIVDAQYSLVLPAIIFLIFKHKRVGYLLLLVATVVSTTKMTLQLANQTAVKTNDMAKMRLHVYPLISRFAAEFYNTAWNRIGPVAIGIFGGHMLHLYETGRIRRWPRFMYGATFKLVLLLHLFIFFLPMIGRFTDDPVSNKETNMTIFILSNATIKPVWSIINAILLLRLITDLRFQSVLARLMSHNIWHCLGKLCFTSYLIHYEIILTLLKSRQEGIIDPNWSNSFREFSAVFLISTALSYIIYILYEAPVNKLIMLAFTRRREQLKNIGHAQEVADSSGGPTSPGNTLIAASSEAGGGKAFRSNTNIRDRGFDIEYNVANGHNLEMKSSSAEGAAA